MSIAALVDMLVDYERQPDDVDEKIGQNAYVGITTRGQFSPNTNIEDARQRWLFRMIHSQRPLQEKMALFWHNHFATAYSKVAGAVGGVQATKMMALKSGELPGPQGQIELFRQYALGNFRNLLDRSGQGSGDARSGSTDARTRASGRRRTSAARSWSCSRSASATTPSRMSTRRRASSPAGTSGW